MSCRRRRRDETRYVPVNYISGDNVQSAPVGRFDYYIIVSCVLPPLVPPLCPVAVNFTMPLFYANLLKLQTTECDN